MFWHSQIFCPPDIWAGYDTEDTDLFVDNETTEEEKNALSTRCWLPEKHYMFADLIQDKKKHYFGREYLEMQKSPWLSWSHPSQGAF